MRILVVSFLLFCTACATPAPKTQIPAALSKPPTTFKHAEPFEGQAERDLLYRKQKVSYDGAAWLLGRRKVSLDALQDFIRSAPHEGFEKKLKNQVIFSKVVGAATANRPHLPSPYPVLYGIPPNVLLQPSSSILGPWVAHLIGRGVSAATWLSIESDVRAVNEGMRRDLGAELGVETGLRPPLPEPWPAKVGPLWDPGAEAFDRRVSRPYIGPVLHTPEEIEEHMWRFGGQAEVAKMKSGDQKEFYGKLALGAGVAVIVAICIDQLFHYGDKFYNPAWVAPIGTAAGLTALGGYSLMKWGQSQSSDAQDSFNSRLRPNPLRNAPLALSAEAVIQRGDYREALNILHKAYKDSGEDADLMRQMGHCYFQLKDMKNSLICYKRALALSPGDEKSANMVRALEAAKK